MRIVIAEDSALLRDGLTRMLTDHGHEVVGAIDDAVGLAQLVEREDADLVVLDVRMPPTHTDEGIRAALVIRSQWPDIAILVLSQYVEERYAADLLSANTRGVRSPIGFWRRVRASSCETTSESIAVPPFATRSTVSTNWPTSVTRSLST